MYGAELCWLGMPCCQGRVDGGRWLASSHYCTEARQELVVASKFVSCYSHAYRMESKISCVGLVPMWLLIGAHLFPYIQEFWIP